MRFPAQLVGLFITIGMVFWLSAQTVPCSWHYLTIQQKSAETCTPVLGYLQPYKQRNKYTHDFQFAGSSNGERTSVLTVFDDVEAQGVCGLAGPMCTAEFYWIFWTFADETFGGKGRHHFDVVGANLIAVPINLIFGCVPATFGYNYAVDKARHFCCE